MGFEISQFKKTPPRWVAAGLMVKRFSKGAKP